jgi:hypothetical protein
MPTALLAMFATQLRLDEEVAVGDLLTSLSILVAAVTLYVSLRQARKQRQREVADSVRAAAADALARLNRYARLPELVADSAQTIAVETSRKIAQPPAKGDVEDARDYLWMKLLLQWQNARTAQRAEGVELVHVKLLGYRPDAYEGIEKAIEELDQGAMHCFNVLLERSQAAVLEWDGVDRQTYQSAKLGNELRKRLFDYKKELGLNAAEILSEVDARLNAIITGKDEDVIDRSWLPPPLSDSP